MTYTIAEHRYHDRSYWCIVNEYGRMVEHHDDLDGALQGVRLILILTTGGAYSHPEWRG